MSEVYYSQQDEFTLVFKGQDIRGWTVFGADGHVLSTVRDLIFNTQTERVDFLELEDGSKIRASDVEILEDRVRLKPIAPVV